jgi:hypothetical protein
MATKCAESVVIEPKVAAINISGMYASFDFIVLIWTGRDHL